MKVTITRSQWLRGEGSETSYLLRPLDQKMCCLGFYALACGHRPEEITHLREPKQVRNWLGVGVIGIEVAKQSPDKYNLHNHIVTTLIEINDDRAISNREERIKELFLALDGTEVEFVD